MIHDLSLPFAKKLDKIIKPFLKKWWGFVRSANTVILFTGSKNTVGLRHKRVETLYKQAQSIKLDILRSSQDSDMHGVYNVIMEKSSNWSKKFSASAEWERLIKFFSYRSLAKQSAGLGHRLRDLRTTRPDLLKRFEVEATDELLNSLNKLQVQGQWKEWSKCMINDFTWNKVLREGNPAYISFQLKAVTNTLPSQDNLKRWNITNVDQNCVLCGKVNPTLRHVLTGCPVSLTQGRFTWRHDSVLKRIVIFLEELIIKANKRKENLPPPSQTFLKTGENKPLERISKETGELSLANDWVILDDVGDNRLIVPLEVCHVSSSLRPDIFIYSFFAKRALILELTCPNEDRFETSHVLKEKKYLKLRDSIIANGFDCNIFTIEVGVRGNICMDQLNIWTRHIGSPLAPTKALFCECTRIARQCSYVLFQTRNLPTWHSRPLMRSIKEEPATASFIKDGKEIFPVEEVKIHKVTKLKTIEKLTIERSWLEKCFIWQTCYASALSILLIANGSSSSPAPSFLLDEDELTGLSLSFSSISSISLQNSPPELMSTGSQTLPADFAIVIRSQSDMGSQTPLYNKKEGRLRLKLSLKCQILENELEQMKERMFYVLFLFYFNAMSASLENDKQLLNGLSIENKASKQRAAESVSHSPLPLNLSAPPSVFNVETEQKKRELLEKENQHLIAECDLVKSSLLSLVQRTNSLEEKRTSELARQSQRADHAEMFYFNLQQRFILLNNELESKCRDETGTKIQLYLSQQEVATLRAGPQLSHFSQQFSPTPPFLFESTSTVKNYRLPLIATTYYSWTPKPRLSFFFKPHSPLITFPSELSQSRLLVSSSAQTEQEKDSAATSSTEDSPIARQWSEGRLDLLDNYCQAVSDSLQTNEKVALLSEKLVEEQRRCSELSYHRRLSIKNNWIIPCC